MLIRLFSAVNAYVLCNEGATAVEYGLIAAGISTAVCFAVFAFGDDLETVFNAMGIAMDNTVDATESAATSNKQ